MRKKHLGAAAGGCGVVGLGVLLQLAFYAFIIWLVVEFVMWIVNN